MTVVEAIQEKLRDLPPHRQQEVLDFVEFLRQKDLPKQPRRSLLGLCADPNIDITEEEIDEARRAMWANVPRQTEHGQTGCREAAGDGRAV